MTLLMIIGIIRLFIYHIEKLNKYHLDFLDFTFLIVFLANNFGFVEEIFNLLKVSLIDS